MRPLSSIRGRTTLVATLLFAVALALAAAGFVAILRTTMVDDVDTALRLRAADLATLTAAGVTPRDIAIPDDGRSFAQIVLDGRVVASSGNVRGMAPLDAVGATTTVAVRETDGATADFRVLASRGDSPSGPVTIVVGSALDDVERTVRIAAVSLAIGSMALVALAGATTWSVVRRALRPVDAMTGELAEIGARDLGRRVPEPSTDDEVRRLAATMNAMLERLEAESRTQREFSSAASHELRTPIAIVRHRLETALASPSPDWDAVARVVLAESGRMQRLVDDLLLLARHDAAAGPVRDALVDLDDLVLDEVDHAPAHVELDVRRVSAGQVRGDADELRRVVRNLLENAARHAAGRVAIEVSTRSPDVVLAVDDDGPGIDEADRERAFERFTRLDEARARRDGGAGLGLSIVRGIAVAHGGAVSIERSPTLGGARLVVRLPDARGGVPPAGEVRRSSRGTSRDRGGSGP